MISELERKFVKTYKYFDFCGGGYVSNKVFKNKPLQSIQATACALHR
jgi:hypothetical protein